MSENYRALTRKYRPRNFEDIVSQEHVSNTLKNAIQTKRIAHAYMFCGPRGVGKTTMARVLARTINEIDESVDGEELNSTLNIIEIDAASNNKVEDVHRIRETVRIPPQNGNFKIYIIDEVHMLSKQAFNALLKTLEEPPPYVIFIFATTEPHKVLPTILSRVQRFDFRRITVDEIVSRLKMICEVEGIVIDDESLHVIAKKADGALRDALGVMDQAIAFCGINISHNQLLKALNVVGTDTFFQFTDDFLRHDATAALQRLDALLLEGFDMQELLIGLTEHFRNMFMAKDAKNLYLVEATVETKKRYQDMASSFSNDDLMRILHLCSEGQDKLRDAHQPRIQLEISLLKLVHMKRTDELQTLLAELRALKGMSVQHEEVPAAAPSTATPAFTPPVPKKESPPPAPTTKVVESKPTPSPAASSHAPKPTPAEPKVAPAAPSTPSTPAPSAPAPNPFQQSFFGEPAFKRPENNARLSLFQPSGDSTPGQVSSGKVEIHGNLAVSRKPELEEKLEDIPIPEQEYKSKPIKTVKLDDLKKVWDSIAGYFHDKNPSLSICIKQSIPSDVHDLDATLIVKDAFTHRLIEQNGTELSRVTGKFLGVRLNYTLQLQQKEAGEESYDPYTRFRKIQQNDPVIGAIVELFGAELDF